MNISINKTKVFLVCSLTILTAIFLLNPTIAETIYGQGIYNIIRSVFHLLSFIAFPLIYILIAIIIYCIVRIFRSKTTVIKKLVSGAVSIVIFVWLFYFFWAFNYSRPAFSSKFPLEKEKMDSLSWKDELLFAIDQIEKHRPQSIVNYSSPEIENKVRSSVRSICNQFGYQAPGRIRVKSLWPKGSLLRIGTAGFYLPFAGEAYIDPGLVFIQQPFTLAHEMCHGYGVTDEGACNFLAYLALIHHEDSTINYSSQLAYFRTIASEYRWRYPQDYKILRDSLPLNIKNDLDEINANFIKYPDIFPRLRQNIYDNYLKMQGIREGMANYENIIGYVRQGRKNGSIKF